MLEGRAKGSTQAGRMGHKESHKVQGQIKNATPGKEELLEVAQRTEGSSGRQQAVHEQAVL